MDERVPEVRPGRALLSALAAAAALAGCGAGEPADGERDQAAPRPAAEPPALQAPAGFARVSGEDWAIAVPEAFAPTPVTEEERPTLRLYSAPAGAGGLPGQVAIGRDRVSPGDFGASVEALKAQNQLERADWRVIDERDAEVPGARLARRLEATYLQPDGTPVRTIDLVVHSERGVRFDVFARAPEADFERLRLAAAIDSFRVA